MVTERPPAPHQLRHALVGRGFECGVLHEEWQRSAHGHARVLFLHGEPGIGKTHLLEHFAARAGANGALVLRGGATEAEGMPPYLLFLSALGPHVRTADRDVLQDQLGDDTPVLAHLLPDLTARLGELPPSYPLPPDQARLRLFEAVAGYLTRMAATDSMVLVLDDLQWADAASLDLLCYVTRVRPDARLLVLGAHRGAEQNAALQRALVELTRQRVLTSVAIGPLSRDELTRLAGSYLIKAPSQELTDLLFQQSEGNPFFAEELLRDWVANGVLRQGAREWDLGEQAPATVPDTIVAAIRHRLSYLSPTTVDVLKAAAILGRAFDLTLLATVTEADLEKTEERLIEAARAGLVRVIGQDVYAFRHDLVRECLDSELSSTRRRRLHESVGQALERQRARPAEGASRGSRFADLAFHFARSGNRDRAIEYARRAADDARQMYAWNEALAHYRGALHLADATDERRADLLLDCGETALQAGAEEEAIVAFESAQRLLLQKGSSSGAARAAYRLGTARWRRDQIESAQTSLVAALHLLEDERSPLRVRALVDLGTLLAISLGKHAEGIGYIRQALELAESLHETALQATAERAIGSLELRTNNVENGVAHVERALALAQAAGDPAEAAECCANLALACHWLGELRRCEHFTRLRAELAHRTHQPHELRHVDAMLALGAIHRGDWDAAAMLLDRAQAAAEGLASAEPMAFIRIMRGSLACQSENYARAEREFGAGVAVIRERSPAELPWYLAGLALSQVCLGKRQDARSSLAELEAILAGMDPTSRTAGAGLIGAVATRLALEEHGQAADDYERLRPFAGRFHYWFLADHLLGQLAMLRADWDIARRHLLAAEHTARREGMRPTLVRVLLSHADLEERQGRTELAQALLHEALNLAENLSLRETTGRIRSRLTAPGAGSGVPPLPAGLTEREADVMRLVAAGRTNREIAQALFLSEKTVANHLTHIFNKTNLENRAAVAAFAIRHGLL